MDFASFAFVLKLVVCRLIGRRRTPLRLLGEYPFTLDGSDRYDSYETLNLEGKVP